MSSMTASRPAGTLKAASSVLLVKAHTLGGGVSGAVRDARGALGRLRRFRSASTLPWPCNRIRVPGFEQFFIDIAR